MEDIDGGLHPAVAGQSLDEDKDDEEQTIAMINDFISIALFHVKHAQLR